jgi:hypothetical protein
MLSQSLLDDSQLDSLNRAISQEIAAQKESVGVDFLNIDAVEALPQQAGGYVYRLVLSEPIIAHPDQVLTFHVRRPRDEISAVVMVSGDTGLVVMTSKPLPEDANADQILLRSIVHPCRPSVLSRSKATVASSNRKKCCPT